MIRGGVIAPSVAMEIATRVRDQVAMYADALVEENVQSERGSPSVYNVRLMAEAFVESLNGFAGLLDIDVSTATEGDCDADEEYPPRCTNRCGHDWVVSDETDRSYCLYCGADGDA